MVISLQVFLFISIYFFTKINEYLFDLWLLKFLNMETCLQARPPRDCRNIPACSFQDFLFSVLWSYSLAQRVCSWPSCFIYNLSINILINFHFTSFSFSPSCILDSHFKWFSDVCITFLFHCESLPGLCIQNYFSGFPIHSPHWNKNGLLKHSTVLLSLKL